MSNLNLEPWLIQFQPVAHPRFRLYCFANAGGSPAQFRLWQQSLPEGVEVCAVQLPGQGSRFREQPFTQIVPLIAELTEILATSNNVPFALWGYSMGALIAFELALALKQGAFIEPRQLFVAARRAPYTVTNDLPIHALPEDKFIEQIQSRYNGIPTAVLQEPELLALFMPVLRANFEMLETYNYQKDSVIDAPIVAFGGLSDPTVDRMAIAAWEQLTSSTFQYFMFPGDHFFVQHHQAAILQILSKNLLPSLS